MKLSNYNFDGQSIVVIGGGSGVYRTLQALRNNNNGDRLSAIITTLDDGGSTGVLRKSFEIPAMGDLRQALCALSNAPEMAELFSVRFTHHELCDSGLEEGMGHSFGNIAFAAMLKQHGTFELALDAASSLLRVVGDVLPVTLDAGHLRACRADGTIIDGETNIDIPKDGAGHLRIDHLEITPRVRGNPRAIRALNNANVIVVGPGDLYTSILPCLIIPEIRNAFLASTARKVYVANMMTKYGETIGFTLDDFIDEFAKYLTVPPASIFDIVLLNSCALPTSLLERYAKEGAFPVMMKHHSPLSGRVIKVPLFKAGDERAFHCPQRLQSALLDVINFTQNQQKIACMA